jgi:hypothetical protein
MLFFSLRFMSKCPCIATWLQKIKLDKTRTSVQNNLLSLLPASECDTPHSDVLWGGGRNRQWWVIVVLIVAEQLVDLEINKL